MSGLRDPDQTLLLTGGTSALGWAVARRLSGAGHGVMLLARKNSRRLARERIADLRSVDPDAAGRIRLISGDLSMPGLFDEGVRERVRAECVGVVHCAVDRRVDVARELLFDVNVGATRALLDFVGELESGAHRFVHVSDTSVSGDARGVWMEDHLFKRQDFRDPVAQSRFLAERHVRRAGVPAVVVRTVLPVGPRPGPPDPVTKLLIRARALANSPLPAFLRRFFLVPGASRRVHALPIDHVADVIAACWADEGVSGRTLQVADPFAPTLRDWLADLSEQLGLGQPGPDAPRAIDLLDSRFPASSLVYDTSNADGLMRRAGLARPEWREGIAAFVGSHLAG
jgi:nucleoside-diphosphate-sugar epimerase